MLKKLTKYYLILNLFIGCYLFFSLAGCEDSKDKLKTKVDFQIDNVHENGPLTVHVRLEKNNITIAQTVLLELQATIQSEFQVLMPKIDKIFENFGIVDWQKLGNKLDENNNIITSYRYKLEPFLSGNFLIPAFTFEFYDANSTDDKKYELLTEPIDIEVTSLLSDQRSELVIADIEDVVRIPKKPVNWWIWLIVLAALASAVTIWHYIRQKRSAELIRILKPAHQIAFDRLRELVKQDLVNKGQIKLFYEIINNILRHYIEHRFELRAPERTTEEFLFELQFNDSLAASDKNSLAKFLKHCDLVKFANASPATQQIQQTFDLVKEFIEKTKSDDRQIDVTDTVRIETEQPVEIGN